MARTSTKSIQIPEGVTLTLDQNLITASGKLGEMSLNLHQDVDFVKEDDSISFQPNKKTRVLGDNGNNEGTVCKFNERCF